MARTVDNNGIGALYATFDVHQTAGEYDLTADDVGKAAVLSGNNEVDLGSDGDALLGRLEAVRNGLATVQVAGVVRLDVNTGQTAPSVGDAVVVDGAGKVYQAPALTGYDPAGGNIARGTVLAVDSTNNTCDVLL
jgi:hypothetical protein